MSIRAYSNNTPKQFTMTHYAVPSTLVIATAEVTDYDEDFTVEEIERGEGSTLELVVTARINAASFHARFSPGLHMDSWVLEVGSVQPDVLLKDEPFIEFFVRCVNEHVPAPSKMPIMS